MRRIGDGQDGRVAPEATACKDRGAESLERGCVVDELEQASAVGALERVAKRLGAAYPDREVTYDRRRRRIRVVARR